MKSRGEYAPTRRLERYNAVRGTAEPMPEQNRSFKPITLDDLRRLAEIARADREDFFTRRPEYQPLREYVLAVALCQGAGLHYVSGTNGIKDLDVWTFYAHHPKITYPPRRPIIPRDFGNSRFDRTDDSPHFVGRRVDCLGRSLRASRGAEPIAALQEYLSKATTDTAAALAKKAVILIEPDHLVGTIAWRGLTT
jgi:hypothetical protein